MLDNSLAVYDFDNSQSIRRQADDSVSAINIRLDADKLLAIPFTKRRMFEVKGMRSTYIVHETHSTQCQRVTSGAAAGMGHGLWLHHLNQLFSDLCPAWQPGNNRAQTKHITNILFTLELSRVSYITQYRVSRLALE